MEQESWATGASLRCTMRYPTPRDLLGGTLTEKTL